MADVFKHLQLVHDNIDRLSETKGVLEGEVSALDTAIAEKQSYVKVGKEAIAAAKMQRLQVTVEAGVEDSSVARLRSFVDGADSQLKSDAKEMTALRAAKIAQLTALASQVTALVSDPLKDAEAKRESMRAQIARKREELLALRADNERHKKSIEEATVQHEQMQQKLKAAQDRAAEADVALLAVGAESDEARTLGRELAQKIKGATDRVAQSEKEAAVIEKRKGDAEGRWKEAVAQHSTAAAQHSMVTGRNPPDRLKL